MVLVCGIATQQYSRLKSHQGHSPSVWALARLLAMVSLVLIGWSGIALAAKLSVANNGLDSATCGSSNAPCRSISQAIAQANPDDTIVVGPGRYGDLNGNGSFGDPGDEDAEVGGGCTCMIKVTKRLTLMSSDGAAVTLLDVGGADIAGVVIQADGVVFGQRGQGFTIANARRFGLVFEASNGTVEGNVAIRNGTNGNAAFVIEAGSGNTIRENVALDNASTGFTVQGNGYVVSDNVASGNLVGFDLRFSGQFTGNVASGNTTQGMVVSASGLEISGNAMIGNGDQGIRVFFDDGTITKNNIFGNDILGSNCGLANQTGTMLMAPNNFWGAATGPGPDPADAVCDSTTIVDPVATKPFNIKVQVGW